MRRIRVKALRRHAAPWIRAAALGAVVGSRSLLVPALVSRTRRSVNASLPLSVLAAMEMAADKTPWIPPRTARLPLAGRMLIGAAVAYGASSSRRWRRRSTPAMRIGLGLVGAGSAAATAFLLRALRARTAGRSRAVNAIGGLVEDLLAVGAGQALTGASP